MFDMGFFELAVVFIIALLVLGPERLPKVVRTLGLWAGRARSTVNNLRYELEQQAFNDDMKKKFSRQLEEMGLNEDILNQAESKKPSSSSTPMGERENTINPNGNITNSTNTDDTNDTRQSPKDSIDP